METSKRKYALFAGISLVVMALAAAFSFGYVHGQLIVDADPEKSFLNLNSSGTLFIVGITGWVVIFLCDLLVAWALYHFLREVSWRVSLATAWLRVLYASVLGVAIYNLILILPLLAAGGSPSANVQHVTMHLTSFRRIWSAGLIIFGFHLLGLGYLSVRSGFVPRIFGWLLLFAATAYIFINSAKTFLTAIDKQVETAEMILSLPMALAEIGFAIWLIIKGGRVYRNKLSASSVQR